MQGFGGWKIGLAVAAAAVIWLGLTPAAGAQARQVSQAMDQPGPLAVHAVSQGYLGVDLADVDADRAQALKLREVRGALITLIDHDAPAGQIGLRVNDVILQLNGYAVEGAEQLRRMLHEIPAGRKIALVISRDGVQQSLTVQLADRKTVEQNAWNNIGQGGDMFAAPPTMGVLAGGSGDVPASGFHMPSLGSSLNVGAIVEPLSSQMADYMGVQSGVMVKQVARKSAAQAAGLKAFDVVVKVGTDVIATTADWDRALRSNEGKSVQVIVLRDKKQQTLNLQVASRKRGALEMEWLFAPGFEECFFSGPGVDVDAMIAELLPVPDEELGQNQ
jgi:membrane-associated protease RseP (regulator of RpoE activity)